MEINGGSAALQRACAYSKIFIFRFGGECEHKIHGNPTQWSAAIQPRAIVAACVALRRRANILQSICVFALSANAEYVYFAICGCFGVLGPRGDVGQRSQYCTLGIEVAFVHEGGQPAFIGWPRAIVAACVALRRRANILHSICVFTLSAKPKN